MKTLKKLPKFKNEVEERGFWFTHDSTEYLDWREANVTDYINLKPSTRSISIRLPEQMINQIKILANKNDIPYQSYMKMLLAQQLEDQRREER